MISIDVYSDSRMLLLNGTVGCISTLICIFALDMLVSVCNCRDVAYQEYIHGKAKAIYVENHKDMNTTASSESTGESITISRHLNQRIRNHQLEFVIIYVRGENFMFGMK
jgi:hypothetical protein